MIAWSALGALVGWALSLKMLNAGAAADLLDSRQWFALARLVSAHTSAWVPVCIAAGAAIGLGWTFLRDRYLPSLRSPRLLAGLLVVAGGIAAAGALGVAAGSALRTPAGGPNILIIVLDTARPDRFSLYGYDRQTTPNLASLASESVVFTNSYSVSSWTPPWHASLFTGLHPCFHGVTQEQDFIRLPSRFLTLAEALWEGGYRTVGVSGNPLIAEARGFGQGFDAFHETWRAEASDGTHPAVAALREWADASSDRPFFAFVNLIEPHSPYDSSREYFGRYDRHPELELKSNLWWDYFTQKRTFNPEEIEHLSDLYDSEIQYVDSVVGDMVDLLGEKELLDNTVVIVTSDHGEHFGEQGLIGHYFNLYETNVRTGLIIRHPQRFPAGTRDTTHVQPTDLFATVLSLAGVSGRDGSIGIDVASADRGSGSRPQFYEYGYPVQALSVLQTIYQTDEHASQPSLLPYLRTLHAVRHGRLKLISGSDGSLELYDLGDDPHETENVALQTEYADALVELRSFLKDWQAVCASVDGTSASAEPVELDEETRRSLRSLGYIR